MAQPEASFKISSRCAGEGVTAQWLESGQLQTKFRGDGDSSMAKRVQLGSVPTFANGKLNAVTVEGTSIVVAQTPSGFCAVENRCPHLGLPVAGGRLEGNTLTCPFHNSQFDLCSGENLDWVRGVAGIKLPGWSRTLMAMGKAPQPIKTFRVVEDNGMLFIDLP
jgi:nitrite reductase/ring-hydroxylating ferredoxin subunit